MTRLAADQSSDIIIVGAGIAGAGLACKLAQLQSSLKITLIEATAFQPNYSHHDFDARVVAITPASKDLFEDIGIWSSIEQFRCCPYTGMSVWDTAGTGEIHFDSHETGEQALGYIVENSIIIDYLLQRLKKTSVQLLIPAKVAAINLPDQDAQTLVILENGQVLKAPLVVATDGATSSIRQMANFEIREWDYGQTALIATVQTASPHAGIARQCFTTIGPLAYLPLANREDISNGRDSKFCSIVWSVDNKHAGALKALDDLSFSKKLEDAFEGRLGEILDIKNRFAFPLVQRHCKQYFKPGIAVAGDAAHTIHPLAGQGINLGLQDILALAEEIDRALRRQVPLSDISILQRYQRRRMGHNLAMMGVMETFKRLFEQKTPSLQWLRNEGMRRIDQSIFIKQHIAREAMGL